MITPEKQREYESRRKPRKPVQIPAKSVEIGKRLAERDGKSFGQWLSDLIELAKRRAK